MKKKMILAVALLVALVAPAHAEWLASGLVVNPTTGTVIIERVAAIDATPRMCVIGASSVTAQLRIQHRNVLNDTTIREQILPLGPSTANQFCWNNNEFLVLEGERIRVVPLAAVIGTVSVTMLTDLQ